MTKATVDEDVEKQELLYIAEECSITLDKNMDFRLNLYTPVLQHFNCIPRYIPQRNFYTCAPEDIYKNVHGNTICKSKTGHNTDVH